MAEVKIALCLEGTLISTDKRTHFLYDNDYESYHTSVDESEVDSKVLNLISLIAKDTGVEPTLILYSTTPQKYESLVLDFLSEQNLGRLFDSIIFKKDNDFLSSADWKEKIIEEISPSLVIDNSELFTKRLSSKPYSVVSVK